jgi:hypothetical protein
MEKDLSVFAFKCTIPRDKRLDYKRENSTEWKFEQCQNPVNYLDMSRRGKKGFIARSLGEGFVSHWTQNDLNQEKQKPQARAVKPSTFGPRPGSSTAPVPAQSNIRASTVLYESQEELYRAMYVVLAGKSQLDRIEKSYRMQRPKTMRLRIPISDLIDHE